MAANASSVEQLRARLVENYPVFAPGKLSECVVIGAAAEGWRLCRMAPEIGLKILAAVDGNPELTGTMMPGGLKVLSDIPEGIPLDTPVIIASHRVLNATRNMEKRGRKNVIGLGVLQTIEPKRFTPQTFYENWLEDLYENRAQYAKVMGLLADETSRRIFDAIVGYRITGDIRLLEPYVDLILFYPTDLFTLGKDETYVDGGAYTGDTIELFIERTAGAFNRVIAFEPDPHNFARLAKRFEGEKRVEPKNLGLFSRKDVLKFSSSDERASGIAEDGDISVPVTSIDTEIDGPVTFIKMNIEGAELEALNGARNTIQKWKPRLCVSGYHKASHLWEVPLLIRELYPDYKLYLRQHDGGVIESTFYALAE
jgi:FkbM family methyltransferase